MPGSEPGGRTARATPGTKATPIENVAAPADACHYWQYCVNCGAKLESRKCKLFCPRCGFYHSCSEP